MKKMVYKKIVFANDTVRRKYSYYKTTHPVLHKKARLVSWTYLFILILKHRLFKIADKNVFPESSFTKQPSFNEFKKEFEKADIISFDIFDTLIFRKVNYPTDVFRIVGQKANIVDFANLRIHAERSARFVAMKNKDSDEVNIFDIYNCIPSVPYPKRAKLIRLEFETEKNVCYANPFMKRVFEYAISTKKTVIAVSDMYWPTTYLQELLHSCGYDGFDHIFVSNELGKNKSCGALQKEISKIYKEKKFVHVGDSYLSDFYATKKLKNWISVKYNNISTEGNILFRPKLESIAGSSYKALTNAFLHSGESTFNAFFEYGYTYGGFLSYGYCQFINQTVASKNDPKTKILFTARDSKAFFDIYKEYHNAFDSDYFYCSREALIKACLPFAADFFFDIMFAAKTHLKNLITIKESLNLAGLNCLLRYFDDFYISNDETLNSVSVYKLQDLFYCHLNEVVDTYAEHHAAAIKYTAETVKGYSSICIVDLGWRGTTLYLLKELIKTIDPSIQVYGTVIGSTHSPIPTSLIDSSSLYAYAFSHADNTDLQIDIKHVMIVETLFSSEQASTIGYQFNEEGKAVPVFGTSENENSIVFKELKRGIYAFCNDFHQIEKNIGLSLLISGREAYIPLHNINKNYAYIISLFGKLNATDLSATKADGLKSILKKYGYKKN